MKVFYSFALVLSLLALSCTTCKNTCHLNDEFYSDFASENKRINAELYLDYFNNNLESLTYEYYLDYFKKNAKPSAQGVYEILECADDHYFKAKKETFIIILYYKKENRIIGDVARTANMDTSFSYKGNISKSYFDFLIKQLFFESVSIITF